MEQPTASPDSSTPSEEVTGDVPRDSNSPTRTRSPKSASARFKSFIHGRDSSNSGSTSPKGGSSTNVGSTTPPRPTRHLSSPNLLSFIVRKEESKLALPSHSPRFARRSEDLSEQTQSSTPPATTTPPGSSINLITPTAKPSHKNVPIYMYLEDECLSTSHSSTTTTPETPTPVIVTPDSHTNAPAVHTTTHSPSHGSTLATIPHSPVPSPIGTPEHTPHSSPRPTRPAPAPPRSRKSSESDILVPNVTVDPPSTNTVYGTPNRAVDTASTPSSNDSMLRSILASPLMGAPSPAFSDPEDAALGSFMSPTVLRRPPPRSMGSGGAGGSTTMDKYNPPRPVSLLLSSSLSGPPKSPPPLRPFLTASGGLDRSSKDLKELPESAFTEASSSLTKIFLSRNHLSELPPSFSHLADLTHLDLSYNKFEKLPYVEHLTKLKDLLLQGNMLLQNESGLTGLAALVNLRKLDLSSNQIDSPNPSIPIDIFYLTSLQELHLPHNLMPTLPADVAWLSNLTVVDFSHNNFTDLPPEIGSLTNLKKLLLKKNKLTTLPDELSSLANLTELDLSRNELQQLPTSLASLYNVMTLHLSFNLLTEIPTELFGGGEPIVGEDGQMWVQGMFALRELRVRENFLTNI